MLNKQLTGPKLFEVINRLKDSAARMQAYENAAGITSACSGATTGEGGGLVQVNMDANDAPVAICN